MPNRLGNGRLDTAHLLEKASIADEALELTDLHATATTYISDLARLVSILVQRRTAGTPRDENAATPQQSKAQTRGTGERHGRAGTGERHGRAVQASARGSGCAPVYRAD